MDELNTVHYNRPHGLDFTIYHLIAISANKHHYLSDRLKLLHLILINCTLQSGLLT